MKSLVAVVSASEQFVDGFALKYFQSDGPECAGPRSIDIASTLSSAGMRDVTMPPNSGMNYAHEALPANRLSSGVGFGATMAHDANVHGSKLRVPRPSLSSPRQTAWSFLKEPEGARNYIAELCRRSPEIATCADLAREFFRMIRQRDAAAWPDWKDSAKNSLLASFAKHLCHDEAALLAALHQPWSNGPVEGHVHRLKLIKRSMYGRAKFDLLRLRVVNAD